MSEEMIATEAPLGEIGVENDAGYEEIDGIQEEPESGEPDEGGESEDPAESGQEKPEEEPKPQQNGRPKIENAKVSRLLREIRQNSPENAPLARALSDAFYRDQQWQSLFPTMDDARTLKSTFDAIGGIDGLAQLQELSDGVARIDEMVESGDPQVIDDMFSESPDGAAKLVEHGIGKLQQVNPEAYQQAIRPHLVSALKASGLRNTVVEAFQSLQSGNADNAGQYLRQIAGWLDGLGEAAQEVQQPRTDPQAQKLQQEREQLAQQKQEMLNQQIGNKVQPYIDRTIQDGLKPFLKGAALGQPQIQRLRADIGDHIANALASDKMFSRNFAAIMKQGDVEKAATFMQSQIDRVRQNAIKTIWNERYGNLSLAKAAPPKKAAAASAGANSAQSRPTSALTLPKKPDIAQLDMSRPDSMDLYFKKQGFTKDGRLVRWE